MADKTNTENTENTNTEPTFEETLASLGFTLTEGKTVDETLKVAYKTLNADGSVIVATQECTATQLERVAKIGETLNTAVLHHTTKSASAIRGTLNTKAKSKKVAVTFSYLTNDDDDKVAVIVRRKAA